MRRRDVLPALHALAALLLAAAPAAARAQLWFNGEGAGNSANSSYVGGSTPGGSVVFDNFLVPAGEVWTVNTVFGDFATEDLGRLQQLHWQVRQGLVPGSALGTAVAGGLDPFTRVGERHTFAVAPFVLTPGEYWLGVWADMSALPPGGSPYFGPRKATGGVNGVNSLLDGVFSYVSTPDGNIEAGTATDPFDADFALGLDGTIAAVPEPGTWGLLGAGLLLLGAARRRVRR